MKLQCSVSTVCSVFSVLPTFMAGVDQSQDLFSGDEYEGAFCNFEELPEEIRQESLPCGICRHPLEEPGIYGYAKIAVCPTVQDHLFHVSCLFKSTFQGGDGLYDYPVCHFPFSVTRLHENFLRMMRDAVARGETAIDCDSAIYKCVLTEGVLLHISGFDYNYLLIPEKALLLTILYHIKGKSEESRDQEHAQAMQPEFAQRMINKIMFNKSGREKLPDTLCMISASTYILDQLHKAQGQSSLDDDLDIVLRFVLTDQAGKVGEFPFITLSNILYLVIKSKLSFEEKSQNLIRFVSTYGRYKKLMLHHLYALLFLCIDQFPGYEVFLEELEKNNVAGYSLRRDGTTDVTEISEILPVAQRNYSRSDSNMRFLIRNAWWR